MRKTQSASQRPSNRGTRNPNNKLTESQVLDIFARAHSGENQKVIAADHGVVQQVVSDIKRKRIWAHIHKGAQ